MNEERLEHTRRKLRACPHFLLARACNSLSLPLSLSLSLSLTKCSLSLSLTGEQGSHTIFNGQRERERERKREGERKRERERKKERKRDVQNRSFIFKRNDGCLGSF
jgi:hypothetical protein